LGDHLALVRRYPKTIQTDYSHPAAALGNQQDVDCMKALYLNSEFFAVSERFDYFPLKAWNGLVRLEERRILVGHDPHLFASRASDLRTERDQSTGAQMG
jgi:hypothetical protein